MMPKNGLLIVLFLFVGKFVQAQDTLVLTDKSVIPCRVLELRLNSVDYRLVGDPGGATFNIEKKYIRLIIYNSSVVDTINMPIISETTAGVADSLKSDTTGISQQETGYQAGFNAGFSEFNAEGARTVSGLAGGFFSIYGVWVPLVASLNRVPPERVQSPAFHTHKDDSYRQGYLDGATKKRRKQVWRSFGTGVGVNAAATVFLFAILLSL